jgi:hypothetical protein
MSSYRSRHTPRDPLDFTPVSRIRPKHNGWTPERQRDFIASLAATGNVKQSAQAAGMTHESAYQLRRAVGAASFCRAWEAAVEIGTAQIRDILIDHAINGVPEPIVHGGEIVGERRRFNHATMLRMIEPRPVASGPTGQAARPDPAETKRLRAEITARLDRLYNQSMRQAAASAATRNAYEVLNPEACPVDWDLWMPGGAGFVRKK